MPELDPFERRLAAAVRDFADGADTRSDPVAVAGRAIGRRRFASPAWMGRPVPIPVWLLLVLGLLLAALLGSAMLVGSQRDRRSSIVPGPSPSPTAVASGEGTVLATARAHALPTAATCPPGSDPGTPGPASQARPAANTNISTDRAMAFDRRAGRVVLLETMGAHPGPLSRRHTWTFDVCTNTWQQMNPPVEPPTGRAWLAYDADSDRTVAVVQSVVNPARFQTWIYDETEDRWTAGSDLPQLPDPNAAFNSAPRAFGLSYHDPSGLIVFHDATNLAAYDLGSDTWAALDQRPDPAGQAGPGRPAAVVLLTYDSQQDLFVAYVDNGPLDSHVAAPGTWTFDAKTATWSQLVSTTTPGIACGWGFAPECGAVFDARTGVSAFLAMGGTQIMGYDAEKRAWQALYRVDGSVPGATDACDNDTPVYDSVNQRIVCRAAWSGVTAIDTGTRTAARPWWLLEPLPETSPAP